MGTDVAAFAKQLKGDGIEAAKAEASKINAEAKENANKIIADAKFEAEKILKDAESKIAQNKQRSEAEIQLSARDVMNSIKKNIEKVGLALLKKQTAEALNEKEVVTNAITELLKNQESGQAWEVSLGKKIAKPLADTIVSLFKKDGAKAKLSEELNKSGFELKSDSGNEVIEVTEDSVTEAFKKLLSPELKKIIESSY